MKNLFLLAILFGITVACSQRSNNTTVIAGTLPDGVTTQWVGIRYWEAQSTGDMASRVITIPVNGRRFEAEIQTMWSQQ